MNKIIKTKRITSYCLFIILIILFLGITINNIAYAKNCCTYKCFPTIGKCLESCTDILDSEICPLNSCEKDSDCGDTTSADVDGTPPVTTRYRCDTQNRKCIEDSNGIYSSLSACGDLCYQVPAWSDKYICLFGQCLSDDNGQFNTLAQCLNYCGQPSANLVTRYRCNTSGGLYQCEEDVNGSYSPLSSCEIICQPGGSEFYSKVQHFVF